MKPLNKLLTKDTEFQRSTRCQSAFDNLKNALYKKPILQYPNTDKLYTLFIDASNCVYASVLTHIVNSPDDLRPISYTSGSFSDTQKDGVQQRRKLLQFTSQFWDVTYI